MVSALVRRGCPAGRARKYVLAVAGLMMATVGFVFQARTVLTAVALVFLLNFGRAAFGSIFLSFNQEIAHGRVGMIAGLMGAIGSFSGSLVVYLVGLMTREGGFGVPFAIMAGCSVVGTAALLMTDWDRGHSSRPPAKP